jgi:hypothetical protein
MVYSPCALERRIAHSFRLQKKCAAFVRSLMRLDVRLIRKDVVA